MIEYPDLEIRDEDRLTAEAVARTSGGLTQELLDAQIRSRQEMKKLLDGSPLTPVCPELTNANPSAPHTVLLEAMGWLLAQQAYRFNQVPAQNHVAFANLFGIEPRAATAAETFLTFVVDAPSNYDVTIPVGTQISDAEGKYVFETIESLTVPFGTPSGKVKAQRTIAAHTLLAPGVINTLIDSVAFIDSIRNEEAIDSGTALESVESTLERVKRYQRRGERIVSAKDLEDAILDEALEGNGVVRAFPFRVNGDFTMEPRVGHTTVAVMTRTGDSIDAIARTNIRKLLDQTVGNQFVYIVDPSFVEFDISFNVRLNTGAPQSSVVTAIENNLRGFYAPSREQFGRPIYRSEIIAVIEGTSGVDRIESHSNNQILISPSADTRLAEYQLAKPVNITINVV